MKNNTTGFKLSIVKAKDVSRLRLICQSSCEMKRDLNQDIKTVQNNSDSQIENEDVDMRVRLIVISFAAHV